MILQALYQLSEREGLMEDPDYELRRVAWLVRVDRSGRLLGIVGTHIVPPSEGKRKPKPIAKEFLVPRQPTGRAGTKAPPCFLVDNAKYVFGLPTKDKDFPSQEGQEKAGWFREMVRECAVKTSDEGVTSILALLEDVAAQRQSVELPSQCAANDLFAFVFAPDVDLLVHERPKVRQYWKGLRLQRRADSAGDKRCLVTGKPMTDSALFPLIENVPGASPSRIALVSFNKPAFMSYGWDFKENAAISGDAAETCASALNRLLSPRRVPRLNLRVSADTAVCFWAAKASGDAFCSVFSGLLEGNPAEVGELYRSIWRGKPARIDDPSAFYALTLTGTQGRVIVRDWFESTVAKVAANLAAHFGDLDVVRNTPKPKERELSPQMPLTVLLESLAPQGAKDKIPAAFVGRILNSALKGTPYPVSVLQNALERTRAEIGQTEWADLYRRDARAALIKAFLNRRRRFFPQTTHYEEVKTDMDPSNTNPGYTLGRLMAVLERIQQEALGEVNASVVDRFFGAASASPRSVFVRLLKNARHHVRKAQDKPDGGGMTFLLDRVIDELADRFDPKNNGFPAHLSLEEQGLFVLGYHQMRKWLWMTSAEREEWERSHSDVARVYLWRTGKGS
jgi:CRISPR-associated protein Csd1